MKKKIVYLVLIILGVVFTVGYFRYNPTVNIINTIPASAESVIRINLREVEYIMIKDVLKHPLSYFDFKKTTSSGSKKTISLINQIEIPKNLFFYTNSKSLKNTWISSAVEIKNKEKLFEFFKQEGVVKKNKETVAYFAYKKFNYFVKGDELKMMFSYNDITKTELIIDTVFKEGSYLKESNKDLLKLKNSKGLIAMYVKNNGFFELKKQSQKILIEGELNNNLFLPYEAVENEQVLALVSGRVNQEFASGFIKKKQKDKFKKLTNLSLDSINNYWNGELDFSIKSFENKTDTITTYEYDDDFNKIEKKSVDVKIIPNINFRIGGSTIFDYLYSKKSIQNVEGENIAVLNPLFKTYASKGGKEAVLHSVPNGINNFKEKGSNKFLFLLNVERYLEKDRGLYSVTNKYLKQIRKVRATITKNNEIKVVIDLKSASLKTVLQ